MASEATIGGCRCGDKKASRYEEVKLVAVGKEHCDSDVVSTLLLNQLLEKVAISEMVKHFGYVLQARTFSNHNFVCKPRELLSKFLSPGTSFWISDSKAKVHALIFNNLMQKFSELVDNHVDALDAENVAEFRRQKGVYEQFVSESMEGIPEIQRDVVCALSETGKNMRDAYEQFRFFEKLN